ncbi:MAG: phosphatidylserine/phosphatidylglycerophosphate/cardiolipin synthase family protein [Dongiaceae bacterium]
MLAAALTPSLEKKVPASDNATQLQFYLTSGEAWEAMYRDCEAAAATIDFEQYILQDDGIGKRFLNLFIAKAKEGVKVRLILDKVGARKLYRSVAVNELEKQGGQVEFYNPIGVLNLFFPKTWFPRTHMKTVIIDSKTAYLGGVCFADEMCDWRDTQLRINGKMVKDIEEDFTAIWRRVKEGIKTRPRPYPPLHEPLRYVASRPLSRAHPSPLYTELLLKIRQAKKRVYLVSPYFLPPWRLRRHLRAAIKRGVEVRIIMGGKTDSSFTDHVSHSYFPRWLGLGMHLHLYRKNVMHAKYSIIDDDWATIGSTNMDYLSLLRNREGNIVTCDPALIAELLAHFKNDLSHSIEANWAFWRKIPRRHKIIGYLGRSLKKIM